ncbi:phosphatase PAP2 family protein [Sulfurimonas sp.]|jgi:lipid A 4'-phosphatase|uniref:phosphatase PAP2 family protein n=1 Tax=Sulfurimonas sp. TaxID=2022749 RepID=UPI0025E5B81F|nr:phosphatase PAP2 family protein [Sulfurimonas sp.]MBT5935573.1 phosphatase PAP2 family protein [Sulfurimonas sp.]
MYFLTKKYLNIHGIIWLLFFALSLLFILEPQLDIYVTNLFYDGSSFPLDKTLFERIFYHSVRVMTAFMILYYLLSLIYYTFTKKTFFSISKKVLLYIFLVYSIAPGLIVNSLLKENWGRARPAEIVQFGGTREFTPAFILSNQKGNSFSSGHVASAFSVLGFVLLAKRRKKLYMSLALSYGVAVSFARIIAGGHFLSDALTSFFLVWIFSHIFYKLIFKKESTL